MDCWISYSSSPATLLFLCRNRRGRVCHPAFGPCGGDSGHAPHPLGGNAMKEDRKIRPSFAWTALFRAALVLLSFWSPILPTGALAQTINPAPAGENAIWQNSTTISGSQAFIDASAWCDGNCQGVDFCKMVNDALTGGWPSLSSGR
jgi:hypothetical protein